MVKQGVEIRPPALLEEIKLLHRCQNGDPSAREDLCTRYRPAALRMARKITGGSGEAEDLVQEAFCRLLAHLRSMRGEALITTWLYRTLRNLHHDRMRKAAKVRHYPLDAAAEIQRDYGTDNHDPFEFAERRLRRRRIILAARQLSRRDRRVLWLRFAREYSHAQIAARLDCTVDAVKCRLYRITKFLRGELAFDL
jgi:RNA polymerase sigma-70 factor (ECF subfamily)